MLFFLVEILLYLVINSSILYVFVWCWNEIFIEDGLEIDVFEKEYLFWFEKNGVGWLFFLIVLLFCFVVLEESDFLWFESVCFGDGDFLVVF